MKLFLLTIASALGMGTLVALAGMPQPRALSTRTYWTTAVSTLAAGKAVHTHVAVTGRVVYTRMQDDGDLHIKLASPTDSTKWIIAECMPTLPCARPAKDAIITVKGISRKDPEHGWYEVHPVEEWK